MNLNPRTRCPYTLKSLTELENVNDEHVIPDALGCHDSYSVRTDMRTNSEFGSSVDANFIDSFLLRMLRYQHRVKSRSGFTSMKLEGKTSEGDHPVVLKIPTAGPPDLHIKKPYIPAKDGTGGQLIAGADWEEKAAELERNFARKGKRVVFGPRDSQPQTVIEVENSINLTHIEAGLMKIAYLAAFEYIGNPFLEDPLNAEWQKAIRATEMEQLEQIRINRTCFDDAAILDSVLPDLAPHEHAVIIFNPNQIGPFVGVRLFGSIALSLCCKISETQDYGMNGNQGKLVICDSQAKTIDVSSWENFILGECGINPTPNQSGADSEP